MYLKMHLLNLSRTNFLAYRRCMSLHTHISDSEYNKCIEKENRIANKNVLPYNYIRKATSNKHQLTHIPPTFNFWLKIPQDKLGAVKEVLDCILYAIILYDDVQDGTLYRRNQPAANRVYGSPLSLTSAIFYILEGLKKALNVYCDTFLKSMKGTALDIYWRDTFFCPTEDEYKAISYEKAGGFFLMVFGLMQSFSQDQRDYKDLMITFGLYYQIRDEYTNLVKVEDLHKLMYCEDITEGKFSWAMIHALKTIEGPTIRSILIQRTTDVKIKQYCLSLLEKVGSLEYTRQTLQHLDAELRDKIHRLGGNPVMLSLLDDLLNWRNH